MSSTQTNIKPNNHRIHPCPNDKKLELLKQIISKNSDEKIIVVSATDSDIIKEYLVNDKISIVDDKTLIKDSELTSTLLISYDVPSKAVIYMARLAHTTNKALLLLNETEQKLLYPIETLLGRVIKQDIVEGFEYEVKVKDETKSPIRTLSKEKIKEIARKNYEEKTGEPKPKPKYKEDDKKEFKKDERWEKKKKAPNKFLGKDENGKALFSGKSGERNHRYDGTPKDGYNKNKKVGRVINIKALKKKED